ncbi:ATG16-domain-containing protein [Stereum hirsutum FP-91666 SS1]|uniref:ATG16-domain-containing protein n=1 Tax=Stereum hirsutum (strain FP-91666) TaxID=721885 RepID=UPI000444A3C0|nr:ATG16-domain-containing protein [Stereum hirsutum FP-91666 SS1]EIM83385.1 ATG16-domain-containing protein [Stereum hirsutum FP-91666 SS1]
MAEPAWQELLRLRLTERNAKESSYAPIIEQYRRLAQQTKLLKERNASLLRAVASVKQNPSSSTVFVPGTGEENPVRAAYISSLESQISSLRDELATVYKTQGQNAQRLLAMNETLREKEEISRMDSEALRRARDEAANLRRKVDQHAELMAEKDRTAQVLHDEISTLQLELGQIEERNQNLTRDNAKLLQRWLDAKQAEVNKMNEANDFYVDMRTRHEAVLNWRDGSEASTSNAGDATTSNTGDAAGATSSNTGDVDGQQTEQRQSGNAHASVSGNGSANGEGKGTGTRDGTKSQPEQTVNLTPNG